MNSPTSTDSLPFPSLLTMDVANNKDSASVHASSNGTNNTLSSRTPHTHADDHNSHGHSHSHGGGHGGHDAGHGHSHGHGHAHAAPAPATNNGANKAATFSHHGHSHAAGQSHSPSLSSYAPLQALLLSLTHPDTSAMSAYTLAVVAYALIAIFVGLYYRHLDIFISAFHIAFTAVAMCGSILAAFYSRNSQSLRQYYTYGTARFELLAAFTNSIFLYFVSIFSLIELFHSLMQIPLLKSDEAVDEPLPSLTDLSSVSNAIGLLVSAFGVISFLKYTHVYPVGTTYGTVLTSHVSSSHSGSHSLNLHSFFLFACASLMQHSFYFISLTVAHAIEPVRAYVFSLSYLVSALILIRLVTPLFSNTVMVLLSTAEEDRRVGIERALREISSHDGVLECRLANFWTLAPATNVTLANTAPSVSAPAQVGGGRADPSVSKQVSYVVGTVHVRIRSDTNEQETLIYVHNALNKYVNDLTVQIERDIAPQWIEQNHE